MVYTTCRSGPLTATADRDNRAEGRRSYEVEYIPAETLAEPSV
ncbi:MAG: hypothetical protein BMS9Abin09_0369 [Gammaproteobacteria bacterium]|nr:MAG: hypothetical protein BMS9Abin09_0369 [Gammaproteobacteria bacterium]